MPDSFRSLAEIFDKDPGLRKIKKIISESDVVQEFNEIFPDLEKVVVPLKVENKILFLRVENPTWRSELKFKENLIVEKINKFFKEPRIARISFGR